MFQSLLGTIPILLMFICLNQNALAADEQSRVSGVFVTENREPEIGKSIGLPSERVVPEEWLAKEKSSAQYELVLDSRLTVLQKCQYSKGNQLIRRRVDTEATIRDLVTGKLIAEKLFRGSDPGECPQILTFHKSHKTQHSNGLPSLGAFYQWFLKTMLPLKHLPEFTPCLRGYSFGDACFEKDGKQIMTAHGHEKTIRFWDPKTGLENKNFECEHRIYNASLSPDGHFVVTSHPRGNDLYVYDANSGEVIRQVDGIEDTFNNLEFSPNGEQVLLSTYDGNVYIVDVLEGEIDRRFQAKQGSITSVDWDPSGKYLLTAGKDNTARVWLADTGEQLLMVRHGNKLRSAEVSPDGATFITGSDDFKIRIWDLVTGKPVKTINHQTTEVSKIITSIQFSADGKYIVTVNNRANSAHVWDISKKLKIGTIKYGSIDFAGFSPDQNYVFIVSSSNRILKLYELKSLM
jgi:WD40 repeat protein